MADRTNTWEDPQIVGDPRIDHENPVVRYAAQRQHGNESLHRHNPEGVVCTYCALAASRILHWAGEASDD